MNREKALVKNTAVIAFGRICTQFISFILLPLYTTLLSAQEYGTVDLFNTYIQLLLPIATLMVEQGAFRYLVTEDDNIEKTKVVTSSFCIIVTLNALFAIIGLFALQYYSNEYKYYLVPMLISASFLNWCLQLARGLKRLTLYSAGSVVAASSTIILNVFFIAYLKMGATGMLVATSLGNTIGALYLFFGLKIYDYISYNCFSIDKSEKMLAYAAPLIPNTLSLWIINSSDRTIVNVFLGASANGILAISHKFPTIFQTLYSIFQLSWHEIGTVHWDDQDRDQFFSNTINTIIGLFSGACIVGIGVMPFVFNIFVRGTDYSQAYMTIPIYMVAVLFNIVIGLLGVVYVATKNTKEIAKTTILAGIINVGIHLLLIKWIGLYAAAVSTLIAYICATVLRIIDVQKYISIELDKNKIVTIILSISIVTICYYNASILVKSIGFILSVASALIICKDSLYLVGDYIKKRITKD